MGFSEQPVTAIPTQPGLELPGGGGDAPNPAPSAKARRGSRVRVGDLLLAMLARGSGLSIILMLVALVGLLFIAALPSIRHFGWGFLVSSEWQVNERVEPVRSAAGEILTDAAGEAVMQVMPQSFGALPFIYGTFVTSVIALVVAVPLSLGCAIFIVRIAPRYRLAAPISFLVEFLAAIPSIAYGMWGLFVLCPFMAQRVYPWLVPALRDGVAPVVSKLTGGAVTLDWLFGQKLNINGVIINRAYSLNGYDILSGGLVLGIMILPIITAVSRDVLKSVPRQQIEGTLALGATWWQSCRGMLRYARAGLFGAIMLGLARAAGETMAVTMVIGNQIQISPSPFAAASSMASLLANQFSEAESGSMHYAALMHVALVLLVMSLMFNVVARWLVVGGGGRSSAAH